jgi:aminoglycoside 3-N-acetyltransferase
MESPLYKTSNGLLYPSDIQRAMTNIGVKKGDRIFVHSDIGVFGKIANFNSQQFLTAIIDQLTASVGEEGTLILPTFSYSFCKGEIFDVAETKSTVGTLSEFFRKQPGVVRTKHPIFSVGIRGTIKECFANIGKDSFDSESIFGRLREKKGKLVFFGASFNSCTYLHHIEQLYGIPYRYIKTFTGQIREEKRTYTDYATFFVRYLDRIVELDTTRLEAYLLEKKIMQETQLGEGIVKVIDAQELFDVTTKLLDDDLYYLLTPDSTRI